MFSKNKQSWIEVDFSHWGGGNEEKDKFQILKNSVLNKNTVEFSYSNANGDQTIRQIEPLKLIFKNKYWYVCGFCLLKNQFRIFKISRISNLNSTEIFFDRDLPDDLDLIKEKSVGYKASNIVLKFSNHISYRVYDEFNINNIEKDADGNLIVSLSYPEDEWLYGYILSFGFYVEVIEPQGLRGIISDKISKMSNIYN